MVTPPPASSLPLVSVVIPHFNDLGGLRLLLQRLQAQSWPADRLEIVIADNNSAGGIDAVIAAAPGCRVVPAPLQGAGPARNAGIAAASGKVLALIDSDCVPETGWVAAGVAALSHFDFVGGQVITTSHDPDHPDPVEAFEIVFNFKFKRYIQKVGFTGTGNMFIPRPVFDRVGPFRAVVSEDMDWSFRARDAGFRIGYAEDAIVTHPARRDWPELHRRWARIMDEHAALARERPGWRPRWVIKALAMPLSIPPHVWQVLRHPRLPGWEARLGAIGILVRLRLWRMLAMLRRL